MSRKPTPAVAEAIARLRQSTDVLTIQWDGSKPGQVNGSPLTKAQIAKAIAELRKSEDVTVVEWTTGDYGQRVRA